MKIAESAGGIIFNKKSEVVIVEQHHAHVSWSFPKGHIEEGEDPFTAAQREIREESGIIDLKLVKKLPVYERFRIGDDGSEDTESLKRLHFFLFETDQETLKPEDPANPSALWVSKEKALELLSHPKDKEFFRNTMSLF